MSKGNRVDELDNQLETTEYNSEERISAQDFDEERPEELSEDDEDLDLTETSCEDAVRANPKRLSAAQRRKASAIIEGLIDDAELSRPEGQKNAWERLQDDFGAARPRPFDINAEFDPNDVIDHPKFGLGFVVEQISPRKVEVLFSEGLKKLACNIQ